MTTPYEFQLRKRKLEAGDLVVQPAKKTYSNRRQKPVPGVVLPFKEKVLVGTPSKIDLKTDKHSTPLKYTFPKKGEVISFLDNSKSCTKALENTPQKEETPKKEEMPKHKGINSKTGVERSVTSSDKSGVSQNGLLPAARWSGFTLPFLCFFWLFARH